jgi:hypothetical protein
LREATIEGLVGLVLLVEGEAEASVGGEAGSPPNEVRGEASHLHQFDQGLLSDVVEGAFNVVGEDSRSWWCRCASFLWNRDG